MGWLGLKFSHSSYKTDVVPLTGTLEKLSELQIKTWTYKKNRPYSDGQCYLGPMAEDVKRVFGVGDGSTLDVFDLIGIVLSAIKEIGSEVKELESNHQ